MEQTLTLPFELESLRAAKNYRRWLYDSVQPFLGQRILELGAGIGNMSKMLPVRERLVLSEFDDAFFQTLQQEIKSSGADPGKIKFQKIDLSQSWAQSVQAENLDTIVSFNVLEHIKDDGLALSEMASVLKSSKSTGPKRIVTVVPAHMWAYGEMDRSFDHHRRYNTAMWKELSKGLPEFELQTQYMNLFGLPGWILMGKILKKKTFGLSSVKSFEALCPILRPIDDVLHKAFKLPLGQSIIAVLTLKN